MELSHIATAPLLSLAVPAADAIKPGEIWPDGRDQHIQAHGGGILKQGETDDWFGEDRSRNYRCEWTLDVKTGEAKIK